mgnify:FL=1
MSVTKVSSAMQDLTDDYAFSGTVSGAGAPSHRNDIINGALLVNQEGTSSGVADATHTSGDLFIHNGEGTPNITIGTSGGPQGTRKFHHIVFDENGQAGLVYFVPTDTVQDYIANGKMSFGVKLKTTTSKVIANARIGLIKWAGTADAPTKEIVGTWASDGTNPTLATSLSYENTPANIGLTTSWARHTVEDITVDSDTTNIVIFIWSDDGTIAANDEMSIAEWQLNPGSTVNAFASPPKSEVQTQVDHFLCKFLYEFGVNQMGIYNLDAYNADDAIGYTYWRVRMHKAPTVTTSAAVTFLIGQTSNNHAVVGISLSYQSFNHVKITYQTSSALDVGDGGQAMSNAGHVTYIQGDARIGA